VLALQKQQEQYNESFENQKEIYSYVINLDRNTERYDKFTNICNQHMPSTRVERFSAVDGNKMTYEELQQIVSEKVLDDIKAIDTTGKRVDDSQLTRGMIGCYMSHLNLYQKALAEHQDIILVFEDDASFQIDLIKLINDLNEFPADWDILLLGTIRIFDTNPYLNSWNRVYKFWGTQGYIINKNGMTKMLNQSVPISQQIDHNMGYFSQQGLLNVYAYKDNVITQNSRYSDVQMVVDKSRA